MAESIFVQTKIYEISALVKAKQKMQAIVGSTFDNPFHIVTSVIDSADFIRLWEGWVTEEKIKKVHDAGKKVWIMAGPPENVGYTSAENLLSWRKMGADGVLVNDIPWARKVLGIV